MPTWESKQPEKDIWESPEMTKLRKKEEMLWEGPEMKREGKKTTPSKEKEFVLELEKSAEPKEKTLWEGPEMRKKEITAKTDDLREKGIIWEPEEMKEKRLQKKLSPEDQMLLDENIRQINEDREQAERLRKSMMSPDELLIKEGYIGAGRDVKQELTARIVDNYKPASQSEKVIQKPKGFFGRIWNKLFK